MRFRVWLAAAGVLFAAPVDAQMAPPKKFPWDLRPNKCFLPAADGVAERPECKADDWPNFADTRRRIDRLLGEPDFDLLERAEREVGFSRERFTTGEYRVEAWYLSLDTFFMAWGERGKQVVSAWAKAKGRDGYAPVAEAMATRAEAWAARGRGYSNTVSPEAWKIYGQKLAEADALLETASPQVRQMAPWYMMKLRIAFERREGDPPIALLKQATELWPEYLPLYTVSMHYLSPRWGGSFAQMDAIARYAMERTRERGKAAMYVLVWERQLRVNPDATYTLRDTQVDWDMMKRGFRELEGTAPWMPLRFAGLACQMRDRDEARRLYLVHERQPDAPVSATDPCRAFAMASQ
jgi:hypothetical protein